jgi:hypothetical protein
MKLIQLLYYLRRLALRLGAAALRRASAGLTNHCVRVVDEMKERADATLGE